MYRPRKQWAWTAKTEQAYQNKRAKLAEQGHVTDEQVCQWFIDQGVDCTPGDVRPMMLDALAATPFERVIASLSEF